VSSALRLGCQNFELDALDRKSSICLAWIYRCATYRTASLDYQLEGVIAAISMAVRVMLSGPAPIGPTKAIARTPSEVRDKGDQNADLPFS
jgi:hypothetical protein